MKFVQRFVPLLIPLFTAGAVGVIPVAVSAQSINSRAAPQISNFTVDITDQLTPGSDIDFTLEGTPKGQATVRLNGIAKNIVLREVESGVYEGSYTLSRRDRLTAPPTARATLKGKKGSTVLTRTLLTSAAPAIAAPAPVPAATATPVIERFSVAPVARIEPGAELRFATVATAGARASFSIEGVVRDVPMREVRPGHYEGAYTIRRNDNFPPSLNIVGTIEVNGKSAQSKLNQSLLVDARPPTIRNLAPKNNEFVAGNNVSVSATFDDSGGVGVDPRSVKLVIAGQDVTRNASITPQFVTWRGDLRNGTNPIELTASDSAGNVVRQNWVIVVGASTAAAPANILPLDITSHTNNAQVPSGVVEVRGRTAPDATVDVQVQAIAAVAGFFGINQQVFSQSLRSDSQGNFGFSFQSQIPVPGARYEVTITATRGEMKRESKLVLFQQR